MSYLMALGIAALAVTGGPDLARQPWDQSAVNSLATDLAAATRTLKEELLREPQIAQGVKTGDREIVRFLDAIDSLRKSARRLSRALGDNKGHEATLPIATRIRSLARDAEEYGSGIMPSLGMEEKLQPVEELLAQLSPYYFD